MTNIGKLRGRRYEIVAVNKQNVTLFELLTRFVCSQTMRQ